MRLKQHIPNLFTVGNLLCGSIAIVEVLTHGFATWAVLLIFVAGILDVFDGAIARALGVSNPIGRELDSLADVVSFGLAPAVIAYAFMDAMSHGGPLLPYSGMWSWLKYLAFLNVICAAIRLARFNVSTDQSTDFSGMPSPANGIFWASIAAAFTQVLHGGVYFDAVHNGISFPVLVQFNYVFYSVPVLVVLTSWLMISRVRMFSFKFRKGGFAANKIPFIYIGSVFFIPVVVLGLGLPFLVCVPLGICWYILMSFVYHFTRKPSA